MSMILYWSGVLFMDALDWAATWAMVGGAMTLVLSPAMFGVWALLRQTK